MKKRIAAVDVGTTKVCTIMGILRDASNLQISGVGIATSRGIEKGLIANVDQAKVSILESVKKAEKMSGYELDTTYVGVNGNHINPMNGMGNIAATRTDRLVTPDDLKRILNVARDIKTPVERRLQAAPLSSNAHQAEKTVAVLDPELDLESQAVARAIASVKNLTKCIQEVGIDIDDLILESHASAEAVLTGEEKQAGVLLANIGGGTTDIAIIKEGTLYHSSVLPVAGIQITTDVAAGLGLPFKTAEEIKKKYGKILTSKGEATDTAISVEGGEISYRDLCDIISMRMEEIVRLVTLKMPDTDYAKFIPSGIVITGGSANIPGIVDMTQAITHLPVRIGKPSPLKGVGGAVLEDPAYATGVGLILLNMKNYDRIGHNGGNQNIFTKLSHIFGN